MKKYLLTLIIAGAVLLAAQRARPPLRDSEILPRDPADYAAIGGKTPGGAYTRYGNGVFLPGGGGIVNSGTATQVAYYASTGSTVSGDANLVDTGSEVHAYGSKVCTAGNGACGGGGGGGTVGSGIPAATGTDHSLIFNGSATIGTGNTYPSGFWSHLGGTFVVGSNVVATGTPAFYSSGTTASTGGTSSVAEDAVGTEVNLGIFSMYSCYCQFITGVNQSIWLGMSSVLYSSMNATNPNGTLWAFRWIGGTDTNLKAYVATSNASFTATDTGIAPDGNFHQYAIAKNGSGNLDYYIDGAKVATITSGATGFPASSTGVYTQALIAAPAGVSAQLLNIHAIHWWSAF